jgi:phage terminase large subunit-like protein
VKAAQNRGRFQKTILPLNINAAVMVSGTVTMYDSFIHDFVHAAQGRPKGDWVRSQGFNVHHFPAIQEDGTSLWPQQWPLEKLRQEKAADPHGYALNYDNDPGPPKDMTFWTPGIFRYNSHFDVAERVLHIDVATTTGADSDHTALVLAARDPSGRYALIERAVWGHFTGPEIHDWIHDFCAAVPRKPLVRVESNQGGELLLDTFGPWPIGVNYETTRPKNISKEDRIKWAHKCYHARAVWHAWKDPLLEEELCLWPRGQRDDVADAVAGALGWCFRKPWAMS